MKKEFVCIVCPSSCRLTVEQGVDGEITVTGNSCKRGHDHGIAEFTRPMRMLTTTVALTGAEIPRLPVISSGEIPKEQLTQCLDVLYHIVVDAPIRCGDILVKDICATGVDICASRSVPRSEL